MLLSASANQDVFWCLFLSPHLFVFVVVFYLCLLHASLLRCFGKSRSSKYTFRPKSKNRSAQQQRAWRVSCSRSPLRTHLRYQNLYRALWFVDKLSVVCGDCMPPRSTQKWTHAAFLQGNYCVRFFVFISFCTSDNPYCIWFRPLPLPLISCSVKHLLGRITEWMDG